MLNAGIRNHWFLTMKRTEVTASIKLEARIIHGEIVP